MGNFIPLSIPNFEGNEEKYAMDALSQGWVSTGGAYITRLEEQLAEFLGVSKTVACQSGTAALHLALMECGVGPGDLVIVPTLTFIAAVNPVRYQFAEPIFMDCDDSLCMDPVKLRRFCEEECELKKASFRVTGFTPAIGATEAADGIDSEEQYLVYKKTGQRIRALVVVHVFGNLADMEAIMDIANQYHLSVVEDATEALGTRYLTGRFAGKMAGTIGDFGAYSFNGNKIITTGGGGALTALDSEKLAHARYISTQAKDDSQFYVHNEVGYNYRMTNLQAAVGVAQMEELKEFIIRKTKNYEYYCSALGECGKGYILPFREGTCPNYWFYSFVLCSEQVPDNVRDIVHRLQEQGIQTRPVWGLIHEQKPYANCTAYEIETANYYSERILNLPCSTQLTREEIDRVARQIKAL